MEFGDVECELCGQMRPLGQFCKCEANEPDDGSPLNAVVRSASDADRPIDAVGVRSAQNAIAKLKAELRHVRDMQVEDPFDDYYSGMAVALRLAITVLQREFGMNEHDVPT